MHATSGVSAKNRIMKKGFLTGIGIVGILLSHYTGRAQESTSATYKTNMLGIRISSKDAVINHSVTFKHFFKSDIAVEGLFSFTDPGALGFLIEKHKPFGPSGLTWFWGAGLYAGFGGGRNFGAQGAVGLDLVVPTLPVNLSIDWKPELNFTKIFSFEPSAVGFSARFVF
jgi:hypothetical protein